MFDYGCEKSTLALSKTEADHYGEQIIGQQSGFGGNRHIRDCGDPHLKIIYVRSSPRTC